MKITRVPASLSTAVRFVGGSTSFASAAGAGGTTKETR